MSIYLSEQEAQDRLRAGGTVRRLFNGGRRPGDKNVPSMIRELAGVMANVEGETKVAQELGLSVAQVHQYKHGRTGQNSGVQIEAVKESVDTVRARCIETALDKTLKALNLIDDEVVGTLAAEPLKLADLTDKLSRTADRLAKNGESRTGSNVQVIVHTVGQNSPDAYDLVEVNERP